MGDHILPKRSMLGELGIAGQRGPGGKEKKWTDRVAEDRWVFGIMGNWSSAALDPGAWYNAVCEEGCRFMVVLARKQKMHPKTGR